MVSPFYKVIIFQIRHMNKKAKKIAHDNYEIRQGPGN